MKKIGVIEIYPKRYGGVVYTQHIKDALRKEVDLEEVNLAANFFRKRRYLKFLESFYYLLRLKGKKDFWVRDFYSTLTMPFDSTEGKNIILIHHDDFSGFPLLTRSIFEILNKLFHHNLRKADTIVTVSEYWKNYFESKGYKNVFKIYNGFDLEDYDIKQEDVEKFKAEHGLLQKPIIYLGNCQKAKGVLQSYEALKNMDVHLVTSGKPHVKTPARNFDLGRQDYLRLLKSSSIALAMSHFREGWCRTAHEAMLLKTPVIGSGKGGMEELLLGGSQIICRDFCKLRAEVEKLLDNPAERKRTGELGRRFAENFTLERFKNDWISLIDKLIE